MCPKYAQSINKIQTQSDFKRRLSDSAIVGLDTRATVDLDTTIKGFDVNHDTVRRIFEEIALGKEYS